MPFSTKTTTDGNPTLEGAMDLLRHGSLQAVHAAARHDDFRREAERDRQFAAARASIIRIDADRLSPFDALRYAVGAQLIRFGEQVRGSSPDWTSRPGGRVAVAGR